MIFEKSTTISDADQNFGPITKLPMDSCYLPQSSVLAETGPPVRMKRCGADKARNCGSQPHQFGASIPKAGDRLLEKMTAVQVLFLHILAGSVSGEGESSSSWQQKQEGKPKSMLPHLLPALGWIILETAVKAHRRGAESFLLKQPTVGIAGRLVFGF